VRWAGAVQSVQGLAKVRMFRGSNPSSGEIVPYVQTGPGTHPDFRTTDTGFLLGVKGCSVMLINPPPKPLKRRGREREGLYLNHSLGMFKPVTGLLYIL
jgi:hypothetical protein